MQKKYSQEDINRIFQKGPSVFERTGMNKKQEWYDEAFDIDAQADEFERPKDDIIPIANDSSTDLLEQIERPVNEIIQILQNIDSAAIDELKNKLEEIEMNSGGGESPDEVSGDSMNQMFTIMRAILDSFSSIN